MTMTAVIVEETPAMKARKERIKDMARDMAMSVVPTDSLIVTTGVGFHSNSHTHMDVIADIWWARGDMRYITTFTANCDIGAGVISDEYTIETKRRDYTHELE